ncbi:hypothetical protein C7212DRAFT_359700 [Tuber magnatum]|uniref:Uncharacterized protein n=1 Tax=Tuber magnatum TaxID=42249 RepID=A0A317SF36_9PEZI|nr:hypothetical protein C7212DRAFT_359700 [Tuber magnatum]
MSRFTLFEHPLWIGHEGKSSPTMGASPYDLPKASHLLPIGDESSGVGKIVRAVADNIVHHAVAYDISSGFMRDAPIPRTGHWAAEEITQKLDKLKAYEAENAESRYRAQTLRRERDSLTPMLPESWDMSSSRAKRAGYPPEIAAEALLKLLEHDKWPRNSIAAIGREASAKEFIEGCVELGIDARELTVDNWNRDMEREGRIPMGRTDMRFDPKIREYYKERNEQDACRDKTIVWVATSASARGLDVPGVFHLYVLHRLEKAREYTTYCGRVARWPFPTLQKDVKDPSSLGAGVRRGVGKVVSLLLEDHVVPASGLEGSSVSDQVIRNDGSDHANWSWLEEGLMVAKIGCHFRDYYGKAGEYSCGPEVWMPKPIRPEALAPTPSRTSNPLGATLGPDPLQEPSFSHPLKESSSGQIPGDLFELAPEQLKQASEKAQPEPSTNLPDLSDIWSLPFSGGSSKPAEELQQPTRSNDGDEANFWSNLKDIAPPPQTPGLPLFKSPQEDFRTDLCHAQERELSRIPAGANNAEDGYREPLKKSRRGQGRDSGRSGATAGVSTFDMGAVGGFNFRYKSPREEFRPDLKSDSERKRETEELSLTAIDAVEGYQEPPGTLKARPYGFGRSRMGHPKKSDQDWEEDFGVRFVPFREAGEELPGSEKEAEETREKTEAPTEEKKAPKEGKKASKGEKKASKEKKKPSEEEKGKIKKVKKAAMEASKQPKGPGEEAVDQLKDLLEVGATGKIRGAKSDCKAK